MASKKRGLRLTALGQAGGSQERRISPRNSSNPYASANRRPELCDSPRLSSLSRKTQGLAVSGSSRRRASKASNDPADIFAAMEQERKQGHDRRRRKAEKAAWDKAAAAVRGGEHEALRDMLRAEQHTLVLDAVEGDEGTTLLHEACRRRDPSAVQLLLKAGADPSARNTDGNSLLTVCFAAGFEEGAQLLLEAGARADHPDDDNAPSLDFLRSSYESMDGSAESGGRKK